MLLEERIVSRRNAIKAIGSGLLAARTLWTPENAHAQTQYPQDLVGAIGNRFYSLCDYHKKTATTSWYARDEVSRANICQSYTDPSTFLQRMDEEKRARFQEFKNAYISAVAKYQKPSSVMFRTRDGSVTREYDYHMPWINLNKPKEEDLLLIFAREFIDEDTRAKRLDLNYINANKNQRQFGELGPKKIEMHGETFFREKNSNIYHSRSGKVMAVD